MSYFFIEKYFKADALNSKRFISSRYDARNRISYAFLIKTKNDHLSPVDQILKMSRAHPIADRLLYSVGLSF